MCPACFVAVVMVSKVGQRRRQIFVSQTRRRIPPEINPGIGSRFFFPHTLGAVIRVNVTVNVNVKFINLLFSAYISEAFHVIFTDRIESLELVGFPVEFLIIFGNFSAQLSASMSENFFQARSPNFGKREIKQGGNVFQVFHKAGVIEFHISEQICMTVLRDIREFLDRSNFVSEVLDEGRNQLARYILHLVFPVAILRIIN